MKRIAFLLSVFAAGLLASSFAFADNSRKGPGPQTSTGTSTSSGPGKSGDHAKSKCRPINLKGTVDGGSITLHVTSAAGPQGKQLLNTDANLTVKGKVGVQAWACSTPGSTAAPQLTLRQLHAGGSPQAPTTTTTP
jgi:hypothetical protein